MRIAGSWAAIVVQFMSALLVTETIVSRSDAQQVQPRQRVEVTIRDFTFITQQVPLQLGMPTVIKIRNDDQVRHDFSSMLFEGIPTQVDSGGVISYGRGIGGVYVDPDRTANIHFSVEKPGRYQFQCSIHPNMKGELLLLNVGAV